MTAGDITPGKRLCPVRVEPNGAEWFHPEPGGYWYEKSAGFWSAMAPGENYLMGNLSNHDVVEHDDGTITVSPSILIENVRGRWHGYLEKGAWREV